MGQKLKVNKKAVEYVRPQRGTFTLNAFPDREFHFRKITVDDDAWVSQTFGKGIGELLHQGKAETAELCRLYFHFLDDEDKLLFPPERRTVVDYEQGGEKEELINGPKKFMQSIDGGSLTELLMISQAFVKTLIASRPISDLPDDLKKSLQAGIEKAKAENAQANPPAAGKATDEVEAKLGPTAP